MTTTDRRRAPTRKEYVTVPVEVKSVDQARREIELYSATWDLDLGGDVIQKGAFARTINHFRQGKHIPLVDSHRYDSIFHALGSLTDAEEDEKGVRSVWSVIGGVDGERTMERVESRAVRKASIGYVPIVSEKQKMTVDGKERTVRVLRELAWEETSLVLFPMNPAAEITGVKSIDELTAALKAGTITFEEKDHLRALLDAAPAPADADGAPALAPERVAALQKRLDSLTTRRLATRLGSVLTGPARVGRS